MGMDYVPVYAGEEAGGTTVNVSPGRLQLTGVRSEPAARRVLSLPVRARDRGQFGDHPRAGRRFELRLRDRRQRAYPIPTRGRASLSVRSEASRVGKGSVRTGRSRG